MSVLELLEVLNRGKGWFFLLQLGPGKTWEVVTSFPVRDSIYKHAATGNTPQEAFLNSIRETLQVAP